LYNAESAQRGNPKQYLKNLLKKYLYEAENDLKIPKIIGKEEINEVVWE
jgi:hypothetical protein